MKRSKFSLSHYKLLSCKMGNLIPISWFEALPGDTIQQATSALVRCAPLITPVMHPVQVRLHHWFVPNRLLWTGWQDFITGGPDGLNNDTAPYISVGPAAVGSLLDYLGLPTDSAIPVGTKYSALPLRAYNLIWNEFYRDEDLFPVVTVNTASGLDTTTASTLLNCMWEKDYLTSARPWAFKGATVTLPLGTSAPVVPAGTGQPLFTDGVTADSIHEQAGSQFMQWSGARSSTGPMSWDTPSLRADLSTATAVDINTVRHAFALQRFEEARARYGSRYVEYLRYLGVRSSDARLQRPEYLGGGRQTIQFSEVLQTGPNATDQGVGDMHGHGITALRSNRYRRFFEEHGIVMTLMSVRPKTIYAQRSKRGWFRGIDNTYAGMTGTKEDYWQRELQHIGQQGINGLECDAKVPHTTIFGYQDRYDEYRREESSVAGSFRTTLDYWHLAREFGSPPALNSTFVGCNPSTRVFADLTSDNLYVLARHSIQARRLVSREGTSGIA